MYAPPVQRLITELSKLPGVGGRTAQRLAFHLLRASEEEALALADAIREVKERIGLCEVCFNLADGPRCRICSDERRDPDVICVVEEPSDVISIERTHEFRGRYHVLGGALSPIDGDRPRGPQDRGAVRAGANGERCARWWSRPTPRPPARPPRCTSPRALRELAPDVAGHAPRQRPARRRRPRIRRRADARPRARRAPGGVRRRTRGDPHLGCCP